MANRKEARFGDDLNRSSGVTVVVTRKGIEARGWFDGFVGCSEGATIPWEQVDAARAKVNERTRKAKPEPEDAWGGDHPD